MLTNRKLPERLGKVLLIDATSFWVQLRKSLGAKRREVPFDRKEEIVRLLADFEDGATRKATENGAEREVVVSRVYPTTHFGFRKITVERPLRLDFPGGAWADRPPGRPASVPKPRHFKEEGRRQGQG